MTQLDSTTYRSTGVCCQCSNPSVKFEAIRGTVFEYCQFHGRTVHKESRNNGR